MTPELHPATARLLAILAEHDDQGVLWDCYQIDPESGAPLDLAIHERAEAGYPDAPKDPA